MLLDDFSMYPIAGRSAESTTSRRYYWNSNKRGRDPIVIIQWTLSGCGIFSLAGKNHDVPKDHALIAIVPEDSAYWYPPHIREPWCFSWLDIQGALAVSHFSRLRKEYGPVIPLQRRGIAGGQFKNLTHRVSRRALPDPYDATREVHSFFLEWCRESGRQPLSIRDSVKAAVRFCDTRFRDPVGVKEIAAQFGWSREHFTRLFTHKIGSSPADYLRKRRLREAALLLKSTDIPLREIARGSGFSSDRHLIRAFQKWKQLTPQQYRKRMRA